MKPLQLALASILAGLAGWLFASRISVPPPRSPEQPLQSHTLLERPSDPGPSVAEILAERDHWKAEAEKLRAWAKEVHQLRSEVTRLRADQAAYRPAQNGIAPQNSTGVQKSSSGTAVTKMPEKAAVSLSDLPVAVSESIKRETGPGGSHSIYSYTENDRNVFGLKGKTDDGHLLALKVAEDGTILERHAQVPSETLPPQIKATLEESFGDLAIHQATQVTTGDNEYYQLISKAADQGMEIRVRADGVLLSYSAKIRPPEAALKK